MDFRILGPLEVTAHDGPVTLGGTKPRALLAMLLLHANEVVSSDHLAEALWGEQPPSTAQKALQVHVSQLRKALGYAAIETRSTGYVLAFEPTALDANRFRSLHEQARALLATEPARARPLLEQALALWRGPPLADFTYERFAQSHIGWLADARLAALEDRIEADLALARHDDVVDELGALVAEHPHRERLRAHQMLALYRSGRQVEALDAYQEARRALVEELGIEPGRELRELQAAILRQDAELDGRPAPAAEAEPSPGAFVGREQPLAQLTAALDDALAGRGRLALIAGEPGIGKSRLAEELIRRAGARGAHVLVGRCWEAGGAPAYWPFLQAMRAWLRAADPAALPRQLGRGAADLAQLLPELGEFVPGLPDAAAGDAEGARFRLFEAVGSFLQSAAADRPLVLVLDDLHAADEPSLLMLRFVAREVRDSRLLIIGAYRDVDPPVGPALAAALAALVREPETIQCELSGIAERDLAEYISASTGSAPAPALVRAIQSKTEGNPLFATETVRLLAAEGRLASADGRVRIPASARAVIGQRLERLSERCHGVLAAASVLGREFSLDALEQIAELARPDLLDALDDAIAARVAGFVPGSPGRLRFGHALIRDELYGELSTARRLELHRKAGTALEALYAGDVAPHLTELAEHFAAAAPAGGAERAMDYARRAGDRAASQLAFEEATRLYEIALGLAAAPLARCELLLALGDVQACAGDTPASKRAFTQAAELAGGADGMADHLAHAALGYGGRMLWEVSRDDAHHVRLLESALDALGPADSPLRVRLLARLAAGPLRSTSYPPERKEQVSEEALAMARRLADPATLAFGLHGYIAARYAPDHTPRQVELASELIAAATRAGDKERTMDGYDERLLALVELGQMSAAKADLSAMARLADELRQRARHWIVAVYEALFSLLEGRLANAEELIERAHALGTSAHGWNAAVTHALQLYVLRRAQGRLDEVAELVRRAADEHPSYPILLSVLAQTTAELGRPAESGELLDDLCADGFAGIAVDEEWLVTVSLLAEASAATGHASVAALYDLLLPYDERVAVSYPEICVGSVARPLGLLAAAAQRWDDAAAHLDDAVRVNERIGALPWLAHSLRDRAAVLTARGAHGDAEEARELGSRAAATYRQLGVSTEPLSAASAFPVPRDPIPPARG
jgi:DNA-binding SARP family transcriptional activator